MNHRALTKRLDEIERTLGDDRGEQNTHLLRVWLADDDEPLPPAPPGVPGGLREWLGRKPLSTDFPAGDDASPGT